MGSCPGRSLPPYDTKAFLLPLHPQWETQVQPALILFYFSLHLSNVFIHSFYYYYTYVFIVISFIENFPR